MKTKAIEIDGQRAVIDPISGKEVRDAAGETYREYVERTKRTGPTTERDMLIERAMKDDKLFASLILTKLLREALAEADDEGKLHTHRCGWGDKDKAGCGHEFAHVLDNSGSAADYEARHFCPKCKAGPWLYRWSDEHFKRHNGKEGMKLTLREAHAQNA